MDNQRVDTEILIAAKLAEAQRILGEGEALKLITKAVEVPDPNPGNLREECIIALNKLGNNNQVVNALYGFLEVEGNIGYWAALAIAKLGKLEEIITPLTQGLKSPNVQIRLHCVAALKILGETPLDPKMTQAWKLSASVHPGKPVDSQIILPLLEALNDSEDEVRGRAISALCHFGDHSVTQPILDALEKYQSEKMVINAAMSFGSLGDPLAIDWLVNIVEHGDKSLRRNATMSLDFLGYEGYQQELTTDFFQAFGLKDSQKSEEFARDFIEKSKVGDEKGMQDIFSRLFSEKMAPQGTGKLILDLNSPDKEIRLNAARNLGFLQAKEAVGPLILALKDSEAQVRASAITSLNILKDLRAIEPLIEALDDADTEVWSWAVIALGSSGDRRAIEPLCKLLQQDKINVSAKVTSLEPRKLIVNALGEIGDNSVFDVLRNFINDDSPDMHQIAITALGNIRDERAFDLISKFLQNDDDRIKHTAIAAIGKTGNKKAYPILIELIKENDPDILYFASEGLGELGDKNALPFLEALKEKDHAETVHGCCFHEAVEEAIRLLNNQREENG